MKIKIIYLIFILNVILTFKSIAAFDGVVTLTQNTTQYSSSTGGEFVAITSTLGIFSTFCIEKNEYLTPGQPYNYRVNTGATSGGIDGATAIDPYTKQPMDNISIGTAWLYYNFRNGTLSGYNYTYGENRTKSANDLQQAFWWLENEGGIRTPFVDLVENALNLNDTTIRYDSLGLYNVKALNIFDLNGNNIQDQLTIIPVPEPTTIIAGLLLLFPFLISVYKTLNHNKINKTLIF